MKIRRKSLIVKRSIRIAGRRTGVGVEDAYWNGLKEIARGRDITLSDLVAAINFERKHATCRPLFAYSCSTTIVGKLRPNFAHLPISASALCRRSATSA
jgi:hypothetical protein